MEVVEPVGSLLHVLLKLLYVACVHTCHVLHCSLAESLQAKPNNSTILTMTSLAFPVL